MTIGPTKDYNDYIEKAGDEIAAAVYLSLKRNYKEAMKCMRRAQAACLEAQKRMKPLVEAQDDNKEV